MMSLGRTQKGNAASEKWPFRNLQATEQSAGFYPQARGKLLNCLEDGRREVGSASI